MNPLGHSNNSWGNWSWNESNEEGVAKNIDTGQTIYAPGKPPEQKSDSEIIDWPSIPFGD